MTGTNPRVASDLVREYAPKLADLTDDVLFADVWERPGLSVRERSLITVAALIALGRDAQLKSHMARALDNGLSREQLAEVATHLAFYAGWPAGMSAVNVLAEVTERGTRNDLIGAWSDIRDALVSSDLTTLRRLLGEEFVLGHMTGQTQTRDDWLDDIAAGGAVYHSIDDVNVAVEIEGSDAAVVTAQTMTDATLGGERGSWRTSFRTTLHKRAGRWVATRTDGSSW